MYRSTFSWLRRHMKMSGQHHAPQLYYRAEDRRWGGPQSLSGRRGTEKNLLPLSRNEPRSSSTISPLDRLSYHGSLKGSSSYLLFLGDRVVRKFEKRWLKRRIYLILTTLNHPPSCMSPTVVECNGMNMLNLWTQYSMLMREAGTSLALRTWSENHKFDLGEN
jgi:hypothetical protein